MLRKVERGRLRFWRFSTGSELVALGIGAALSLTVGSGAFSGNRLLLLDWVVGAQSKFPPSVWGLEGGVSNGVPFTVGILELNQVLGPLTTWLPLLAFFPLCMVTMARLVGGGGVAPIAAGVLYSLNPVVFERVQVGQFAFLLGYALLPILVRQLLEVPERSWYWSFAAGALAVLCVSITAHYGWIIAVLLVAAFLARPGRRSFAGIAGIATIVGLLSAYSVVLVAGRQPHVTIGLNDLATYRTMGDATWGLFGNVLGLYGFWRVGPALPKGFVAGWPLLLLAILVLGAVGLFKSFRSEDRRPLARLVAATAVFGFVLSLGDQGPFGSLYRWAFDHVPLFAVMREPQKFIVLLAMSYAVCFGWGVEAALETLRSPGARRLMLVAGCSLPLIYTPTMFVGLAGGVEGTRIPPDWRAADNELGDGPGRVLALPWHQYLSFPFTRRVIANPTEGLLRREVISGDNVEVAQIATSSNSSRSAYLEYLYSQGPRLCAFGLLVAPLGVEYILLAKTVDFAEYDWLDHQRDLTKVLDLPNLAVYRNASWDSAIGPATPVIVRDWADLGDRANRGEDVRVAVAGAQKSAVAGRSVSPGCSESPHAPLPPAESRSTVVRRSRVSYAIASSGVGVVALPELYDKAWQAQRRAPTLELAGGTLGVEVKGRPTRLDFHHWREVRIAYLLSGTAFVGLLLSFALLRRRDERLGGRPE